MSSKQRELQKKMLLKWEAIQKAEKTGRLQVSVNTSGYPYYFDVERWVKVIFRSCAV